MQNVKCPQCGALNRTTARFCGNCRAPLQAMPQQAAPAPQAPAPIALPRIPPTVIRGFGAIFQGMARLFTFGGRAAYADLIAPEVAASGLIASPPIMKSAPAPIELGCFAWAILGLLGAATLLISGKEWWWGVAFFVVLYVVLLVLSLVGLRRPFFSRLTVNALANMVTGAGRGTQPELEFTLTTQAQNQMLVTLIGPIPGLQPSMPKQGHAVQVWGIATGPKTMRAWKLEFLDEKFNPSGIVLATARVISLTAALFIPATFWLIVWLIVKVWLRLGE